MTTIKLTQESSEDTLKHYFQQVFNLAGSDQQFPVDFDEVWPLVYSRRDNAVRELTTNPMFIEDIDYQSLLKNEEQDSDKKWGGNNKVEYRISVSCLEYLIVRKVRPVFEVYRRVFHEVAKRKEKTVESKKVKTLKQQCTSMNETIETLRRKSAEEEQLKNSLLQFVVGHGLFNGWLRFNKNGIADRAVRGYKLAIEGKLV